MSDDATVVEWTALIEAAANRGEIPTWQTSEELSRMSMEAAWRKASASD